MPFERAGGGPPRGVAHPKLRELPLPDLFNFAAVENQLVGYDACIWAVGISSVGLDEAAYARVTRHPRPLTRAKSQQTRENATYPGLSGTPPLAI